MTVHVMLRGETRPISVVPIYIDMNTLVEVATMPKNCVAQQKRKKALWDGQRIT